MTSVLTPTPSRPLFVLAVLFQIGLGLFFRHSLEQFGNDYQRHLETEIRTTLANAASTVTLQADRAFLLGREVRGALAEHRRRISSTSQSATDSTRMLLGELQRRLPRARILAFDEGGKLFFQNEPGPRKSWELIWAGIHHSQGRTIPGFTETQHQTAQKMVKSQFGSLTTLHDFYALPGKTASFLRHGVSCYSLILPAATWQSGGAGSRGYGGIWLQVSRTDFSRRGLLKRILRHPLGGADILAVFEQTANGQRLLGFRGAGRPSAYAMKKLAEAGVVEDEDASGYWAGRYLPGETGLYIITGIHKNRVQASRAAINRLALSLGGLFFLIMTWGSAHFLWQGHLVSLSLSRQVLLVFLAISVFPWVSLIVQGNRLADEKQRQTSLEWQNRLKGILGEVDQGYQGYLMRQNQALQVFLNQHRAKAGRELLNEEWWRRRLTAFTSCEFFLLTESGQKLCINKGIPSPHSEGEYSILMGQYLARLIEIDGRTPQAALLKAPTLVIEGGIDAALDKLFPKQYEFNKIQVGRRDIQQLLIPIKGNEALGVSGHVGLLSWVFDVNVFARPYMRAFLRRSATAPEQFAPVIVGYAAPDGRIRLPGMKAGPALSRLVRRARYNASNEIEKIALPPFGTFLVMAFTPRLIPGHTLIAALPAETRPATSFIAKLLRLVPVSPLEEDRFFLLRLTAVIALLSMLFMIPTAWLVATLIVERFSRLQEFVANIRAGHFAARLTNPGEDEIGRLGASLNRMAEGLEERQRMSRYVSAEVQAEVKKSDRESLTLGGSKRNAAVLFSHLQGMDERRQSSSPQDLIAFLNRYIALMDHEIKTREGTIGKRMNDAILAVFFEIPGQPHPAVRAVDAALAMLRAERNSSPASETAPSTACHTTIGIHFGPVIWGKVGSRIGFIDYTVIGDTVNSAARLEGLCSGQHTSLTLSEAVFMPLPENLGTRFTPAGILQVKGKQTGIPTYCLGTRVS